LSHKKEFCEIEFSAVFSENRRKRIGLIVRFDVGLSRFDGGDWEVDDFPRSFEA
jgi:hypothetical protein